MNRPSEEAAPARPAASVSLDLDNQWSYMKSGAIPGWESFPSYLDLALPRLAACLDAHRLRITVFVVGQDAERAENRAALRLLGESRHEIANHSFHHEPWLNRQPAAAIRAELARAHAAIAEATGQEPVGFRGPGFSLSTPILTVLRDMGYLYDASTFPTFVGPLARQYYFLRSGFSRREREVRAQLFGSLADGRRPLSPYNWRLPGGATLLELPVTTCPGIRMPVHLSYLTFIAGFAPALALAYFRAALSACRLAGLAPSLLLHPLDVLGSEDVPCLSAFPGMRLGAGAKLDFLSEVLRIYAESFEVLTMREHAARILAGGGVPEIRPRFEADHAEPLTAVLAEERGG